MKKQLPENFREYLASRDSGLADRANVLWNYVSKHIHSKQTGRKPTEGGHFHCELVEHNIWRFIKEKGRQEEFNNIELFILSCSACCHDFDKGLLISEFSNSNHGFGSGSYVYENSKELILSKPEALAIYEIIKIHDLKGDNYKKSLYDLSVSFPVVNGIINLRLLAALLKVGDVLHSDNSRASDRAVNIDDLQGIDRLKFLSRMAIIGWQVDGTRIILTAYPDNPEEKEAINKCLPYLIDYEWNPLKDYLSSCDYPYRLICEIKEHKIKIPPKRQTDCIILCGGYATRLWPLTQNLSKALLPIAGRCCFSYILNQVNKIDCIGNIHILINEKLRKQFEYYIKKNKLTNLNLIVEPKECEKENWGPIRGLIYLFSQIECQDCLIIGGDNIFNFSLNNFIEFASLNNSTCIAVYRNEYKESAKEYGAVKISGDGKITMFQEKQEIEHEDISTAIYFLRKKEVMGLNEYFKSAEYYDNLGHFFHWLMNKEIHIAGYIFKSYWYDIGNRKKLLEANKHLIKNINKGAIDNETILKAPSYIEKNVISKKSEIGPYAFIEENCIIENSAIVNSIIMDNSKIINSIIINSVIGSESMVEGHIAEMVCGPNTSLLKSQNP